jgi:hypothetical protein
MSSEPVKERAKQTLKAVRELLEKAEETTHKALEETAPKVAKSIDASMEAAAKGFSSTMKSIDGATGGDQVKLLKAYKKFLGGQLEFVDSRIKAVEEKKQKDPAPAA